MKMSDEQTEIQPQSLNFSMVKKNRFYKKNPPNEI